MRKACAISVTIQKDGKIRHGHAIILSNLCMLKGSAGHAIFTITFKIERSMKSVGELIRLSIVVI